ncbi:DNA-binding transcriptional LysR family regulator [Silvimonas terrae]|uniref:DNA-binding transcriptional LysR family regulator n=1 Tax=Silvimonas terrae TaxID=300266 RepID=A0A840RF85_9NEIS|nr:LysR family transcriptional regulator [Silvimonas terrae]MBB5190993.1 DNA-binding transcriptional LysR family regulator [Silvimonas terrae]
MDLDALRDFNLIATHGGLGKASRASGRPKATLSRRVMELEASLGVRLLERGSRSLRLTEAGASLFGRTAGLLHDIAEAGREISSGQAEPTGVLRISVPLLFSQVAMGRIAAGYVRLYPAVRLEVVAEDRMVDLVEEGFDIAIRTNPAADSALVGRCFLRDQMHVIAPVDQLCPNDGAAVPAVVSGTAATATPWSLQTDAGLRTLQPEPVLRLSSLIMVRDAVRAGAGAAMLPESLVADDLAAGRLVSWGQTTNHPVEVWVLHASRRLASSKVTSFVQYLCGMFPDGLLR